MDQFQRAAALSSAFSPSAPIDQQSLFSGRMAQLMDVVNAVNQKGQHAILFGERGVGKTSLSRVLSKGISLPNNRNLLVASINCDPSMTFSSLWHQVLREITVTTQSPGIGFTSIPTAVSHPISYQLPAEVTPDDIRHLFNRLPKSLIVIDELDRLGDKSITALLSDTIKTLSDHAVDVTLLLVGVADSVDTLIQEHQIIHYHLGLSRRQSLDHFRQYQDQFRQYQDLQ
ncbi:MAG: ATP-binding protein [Cytophagaceae bacterium]|nr:MAG: ATP-binding protein [Cytophagaceae bacterium]